METITESVQQKVTRLLSTSANADIHEVWEVLVSVRKNYDDASDLLEVALPLKAFFYDCGNTVEELAEMLGIKKVEADILLVQARAMGLVAGSEISLISIDEMVGTACRTTGVRTRKVIGFIEEAELRGKDTDWLYAKLDTAVRKATATKREPKAEDVQARLNINKATELLEGAKAHLTEADVTAINAILAAVTK
ncbi:hypothetical protein UFOVP629_96 [uncultured Caudovirales phage]|uniref:Uncharacterized protein n=1 Tax=uncultured Caudovirales phage TaxID=2100421 RepID=A0A6J5NB58_9CAUD|nr:hypothetical protein UFOVP629_96 [uncultured Caudovirales phage]